MKRNNKSLLGDLPHLMLTSVYSQNNKHLWDYKIQNNSSDLPFITTNGTEMYEWANFIDNSSYNDFHSNESTSTIPVLYSPWEIWAWTVALVFLLIIGLIGNSLVIAVVARTKDLRSSTNLLLVNLAGADLLVLLVPLPTALTELHSKPETWVLGKTMCKAVPFVEWTVSHASVLTILVIGSERYYAICRPLRASYTCTRLRALTCIACIWAAVIAISVPVLFLSQYSYSRYVGMSSLVPTCTTVMNDVWGKQYYTSMIVLLFFLPLSLLLGLYLLIARRLMRDSTSQRKDQSKPDPPNIRARKQVVVMLASVTLFFFACLLPFRVFSLVVIWDPENAEWMGPSYYYNCLYATRMLLYVNASINPILYNLTSTKFRDAFVKIVNRENVRGSGLSRHSTFTTTGNSYSNGRSGSHRYESYLTTPNGTLKGISLASYGRQWSLDAFPTNRKPLTQYERPNSFTAPNLCEWNNGKSSAIEKERGRGGGPDTQMVFIVKESNNKFQSSFKDVKLPSVEEYSGICESISLEYVPRQTDLN